MSPALARPPNNITASGLENATASAIFMGYQGMDRNEIRSFVADKFGYDMAQTVDEIRPWYAFDETCPGSVPQALTCEIGRSVMPS